MGIEALGLKNGTSGWLLAGFELENGADRVELPEVSDEGRAAADEYAARLAEEDGVRYLSPDELADLIARRDTEAVYLVDVRTDKEFTDGHIPGFRWWPGGQAVQRADDLAVVKNSTIVFCCDGRARATVTGSFYRQMGHKEVYAVDGGAPAWAASGRELATGMERSPVAGLGDAFRSVKLVEAQELHDNPPEVVLFVDTSQDFSAGHTPGAKWLSRSWLEIEIGDIAPDKSTPIAVTCATGRNSALAAVDPGRTGLHQRLGAGGRHGEVARGWLARRAGPYRHCPPPRRHQLPRRRPQLRRDDELPPLGNRTGLQVCRQQLTHNPLSLWERVRVRALPARPPGMPLCAENKGNKYDPRRTGKQNRILR